MQYEPATPEDTARLREMIEQYLDESKLHMTVDELLLSVNLVLPTRDENNTIQGFIAYDVFETANYGKVAVWRILHTAPEHRENFTEMLQTVLAFFEAAGYKYVETQCNYKVDNFFRRKLKSRPIQFVHFGSIKEYLRRL